MANLLIDDITTTDTSITFNVVNFGSSRTVQVTVRQGIDPVLMQRYYISQSTYQTITVDNLTPNTTYDIQAVSSPDDVSATATTQSSPTPPTPTGGSSRVGSWGGMAWGETAWGGTLTSGGSVEVIVDITGQVRIYHQNTTSVSGAVRIAKNVNKTIAGRARIAKNIKKTIKGRVRVIRISTAVITGQARIEGISLSLIHI